MDDDPFDSILQLEDTIYRDAYATGQQDGARAGFLEGSLFGLEKGFNKGLEMGLLHGRAIVWANRLNSLLPSPAGQEDSIVNGYGRRVADGANRSSQAKAGSKKLPILRMHGRLEKHIQSNLELIRWVWCYHYYQSRRRDNHL